MPIGDDFRDATQPISKKHFHYPPPDGTGEIDWPQGQTFAQVIGAALPNAVRQKTLPFNAKIRLVFDVYEE